MTTFFRRMLQQVLMSKLLVLMVHSDKTGILGPLI